MELFECARCHLGSRAAILAAGQRLLPALWFVGVRVRTQSSRIGAAPSPRLVGSGCRVLVRTLASCKTLETLGAASDEQPEALRIEALPFFDWKQPVVTPLRRVNESEQCCGTPEAVSTGGLQGCAIAAQ